MRVKREILERRAEGSEKIIMKRSGARRKNTKIRKKKILVCVRVGVYVGDVAHARTIGAIGVAP
jgi:hypothetical protein